MGPSCCYAWRREVRRPVLRRDSVAMEEHAKQPARSRFRCNSGLSSFPLHTTSCPIAWRAQNTQSTQSDHSHPHLQFITTNQILSRQVRQMRDATCRESHRPPQPRLSPSRQALNLIQGQSPATRTHPCRQRIGHENAHHPSHLSPSFPVCSGSRASCVCVCASAKKQPPQVYLHLTSPHLTSQSHSFPALPLLFRSHPVGKHPRAL
jgi:hypothetical protein